MTVTLRPQHGLGTLLTYQGREYDLAKYVQAIALATHFHLAASADAIWASGAGRDEVVRMLWMAVLARQAGTRGAR